MMFKRMACLSFFAVVCLGLSSCGNSTGGGVAAFNTVNATASVDSAKNPLLSDLATWTGTPCATGSTITIKNDVINFSVTTTVSISNGTPSTLQLQKATITFTPADTVTPVLPALYAVQYQNLLGQSVPAGGTLSVPIEIATHSLKEYLLPKADVCVTNSIYNYNVQVNFDAVESGTGKSGSIPAGLTVRFSDFADS